MSISPPLPPLSAGLSPSVRNALRNTARLVAVAALLCLAACAGPAAKRADAPAASAPRALILISIDGLRADVPGTGKMPTLDALAAGGVRAEWMTPSYPTLTFPNHYTLVTGLRPDRHGIVHNNMRDARLGVFMSKESSAKDGRWWGGEPIWATLQRQGGIAATMFWPGSEAEIAGQRPRMYRHFDGELPPNARVDQVLAWLDLPVRQRPRLITLYFEQFDVAAHGDGIGSPPARAALRDIDAALQRLLAGLDARGLRAGTDLILVSDHGMADVPREQVRWLDDRLAEDAYEVVWWGHLIGLEPAPGRTAEVERAFLGRQQNYACWRKGELPRSWRYGAHPRIPSIVCQADAGWRVQARRHRLSPQAVRAEHGFAPEDPSMRAVFVANGPSFRSGTRLPPFESVDLYPLMARLLGVQPAENDGDLRSTEAALR